MNDQMITGMAAATRLTRAGKLHEATALIQRLLHGTHASEAAESSAEDDMDEPIDVPFQVMDPPSQPMPPGVHEPIWTTHTVTRGASPQPERAAPAGTSERASVEVLTIPPVPSADQPAAPPQAPRVMPGSTNVETVSPLPGRTGRSRPNVGRQVGQTGGTVCHGVVYQSGG